MKTLLQILPFVFSPILFSQENLVPNGSFEEYLYCPQTLADFSAEHWFSPISPLESTPDYYNVCGVAGETGVPLNGFGFQLPQDSNAYAGIVLNTIGGGGREYLAVKLTQTLITNKTYYFEYFISVGDSPNLTSNNLGVFLLQDTSQLQVDTNLWGGFKAIRSENQTVIESSVLGDTSSWLKIFGYYSASGNENYLMLGNFRSDDSTIYGVNDLNSIESYYFIDNVALYESNFNPTIANVFTPNGDEINEFIDFSQFQGCRITIVNRWGDVVFIMGLQSNYLWYGKDFRDVDLTAGVYYYVVHSEEKSKTGLIHLIR